MQFIDPAKGSLLVLATLLLGRSSMMIILCFRLKMSQTSTLDDYMKIEKIGEGMVFAIIV